MSVVIRASGDAASVASTRQNPDELEDFSIVDIDALQQHGINVADIKVLILFHIVPAAQKHAENRGVRLLCFESATSASPSALSGTQPSHLT